MLQRYVVSIVGRTVCSALVETFHWQIHYETGASVAIG